MCVLVHASLTVLLYALHKFVSHNAPSAPAPPHPDNMQVDQQDKQLSEATQASLNAPMTNGGEGGGGTARKEGAGCMPPAATLVTQQHLRQ